MIWTEKVNWLDFVYQIHVIQLVVRWNIINLVYHYFVFYMNKHSTKSDFVGAKHDNGSETAGEFLEWYQEKRCN